MIVVIMSESNVQAYIEAFPENQPGIALDIGANIGKYTSLIASRFQQCIAIEPHPDNLHILRQAIANVPNVKVLPMMVSDVDGVNKLYLADHPGCHTINENKKHFQEWGFSKDDYIWVPSFTLDNLAINHKNIRFIKCDIEGGENIIWYYAKDLLTHNKLSMIIEIHVNIESDRLYDWFTGFGYRIFSLDTQQPVDSFKHEIHYIVTNCVA